MKHKMYWTGAVGNTDDFGVQINNVIIDGKTRRGPWALMTPASWRVHGVGQFGTGFGQRYERTPEGKWLKVEG
jgi:hypothetical protein